MYFYNSLIPLLLLKRIDNNNTITSILNSGFSIGMPAKNLLVQALMKGKRRKSQLKFYLIDYQATG